MTGTDGHRMEPGPGCKADEAGILYPYSSIFFQGGFRNMLTSVVEEEFCRRRFDTLTTQGLFHAVQLIFVNVRRDRLTRILDFKLHSTFAVPPNTKHHLSAVCVRFRSGFWSVTGV